MEKAQAVAKDYDPFGLKYCLVDAAWQAAGDGEKGSPIGGDWNARNDKFPHGMKWLANQPGSHSGAGGPDLATTCAS
ncbi:MAG TPA: hypothetical protein VGW37_01980 [Terriglobia bacterium]|nr:hypothetical protein [Terriglobia bacterium]